MSTKSTQWGIIIQCFLSYCIAGAGAAILVVLLIHTLLSPLLLIACATLISGLLGLLLTTNIQRGLSLLDRALLDLSYGQASEKLTTGWRWPLTLLFEHLQQLKKILEEQTQRAELAADQRSHLLQTVREAAVQEERNRLARELHDSIKQQIFSIGMSAAAIEARMTDGLERVEAPLADIQQSVLAAQGEMDALLQQLRPGTLTIPGIVEHLRAQFQALAYRINGQATVEVGILPPDERFSPVAGDALQRIVQEATSNIARHARAQRVRLYLGQHEDELLVEIVDDGRGFVVDEANNGMGLTNMQTRAQVAHGELRIQSHPGATIITLRLPLLAPVSEQPPEKRLALKRQIWQAHQFHEVGELLLLFTYLGIFLPLPFVLIALGPVLVGIASGLATWARKRLLQHIGTDNRDMLTIQSQTRKLNAGALLTLSLLIWYLSVIWVTAPLPLLLLTGGVSLLLLALALFFLRQGQQYTAFYLEKLSPQERLEEGRRRRVLMLTHLSILLLIVFLELFTGPFMLTFPPHTLEQWSYDASLPLLLCWLAWEMTNGIRNRLWRRNPFANEKERTQ